LVTLCGPTTYVLQSAMLVLLAGMQKADNKISRLDTTLISWMHHTTGYRKQTAM